MNDVPHVNDEVPPNHKNVRVTAEEVMSFFDGSEDASQELEEALTHAAAEVMRERVERYTVYVTVTK
jgi:hypothetical protein